MEDDHGNISFNALRNALYHTGRRMTFERWNRWANALVILLGAGAMADVLSGLGVATVWLSLCVTVTGTMQLVFDFGGRARDHQALQRDYYNLLAEIEETPAPDAAALAAWRARMTRIAGDEPPTLRALDAKAYNDAFDALEFGNEGDRLVIPRWHRFAGQFLTFEGYRYPKRSEIE